MRPLFADRDLTDACSDPEETARTNLESAGREERYREWRQTRVLFLRAEALADRAVVADDLPPQRTGAAL